MLRQQGVGLANGWVLQVVKENEYELVDRTTGDKIVVWGDPHLGNGANRHYGDFTNSVMVFVLPGERPDAPTLIIAKSTGGSAKDGFGLPTEILVLGLKEWVHVTGLNTASARGARGEGALFVHAAALDDLKAAHVLYWVPETKELRTQSGERSAPPDGARAYDRKAPGRTKDPLKQFDGLLLAANPGNSPVPGADLEVMERFRQAVSARDCPVSGGAKDRASEYVAGAKKYGATTVDYIQARLGLLDKFEKAVEALELLDQEFSKPGLRPDEGANWRRSGTR